MYTLAVVGAGIALLGSLAMCLAGIVGARFALVASCVLAFTFMAVLL